MADSVPAPAAPAAEPTLVDLASLISPSSAAKAPAANPRPAAPAAPASVDEDPSLENLDDDTTTLSPEAAQPEEPAAAAPEAPAEETPAPEETPAELPPPEGMDEEDLATRRAFTPEQQKAFDKAVQKKHAKAKAALEQVQALQAELEQARATPPAPAVPTPDNPLADVTDERELDKRLDTAKARKRWAMLHPQGGTVLIDGQETEVSQEQAAAMLLEATDFLEDHGPKRREYLRQNHALEAAALQDYPWLKSPNNAGTVAVNAMLSQFGGTRLRDIPGIKGALADLFMGQIIRQQGKQPAAKAAVPPAKAPATPAGHRPPPKTATAHKQAAVAEKTLVTTGTDPGNAALSALISRKR